MDLTLEECRRVLYNYAKSTDVRSYKLIRFSEQVVGFLGDHYILEICYSQTEKEVRRRFFVKTVPVSSRQQMQYIQECGFFKKELVLYENLLPRLQNYFSEKIVPNKYLLQMDRFIVLENLKDIGYDIYIGDLTLDHCHSLLNTLARFHSSSIIFEEEHSEIDKPYRLYDHFEEALFEAFLVFKPGHPRRIIFETTLKAVMDVIDVTDQTEKKLIMEKLEDFARNKLEELVKPSETYRNTLTHCDLWRNNMMFRENNNKLECVLVDFQLTRYAPPAWDVLLTLYLNCSLKFLEENMESLLTYYFCAFSANLKLHRVDSDKIMNRDEFFQSVKVYRPIALFEALFFATMVFVDKDFSKQMLSDEAKFKEYIYNDRSTYTVKEFMNNAYFKTRFTDILVLTMKCFEVSSN